MPQTQTPADRLLRVDFAARLADLYPAATIPFADFLALLHAQGYTGAVTFHVFNGVPSSAELAADPVKIRLTHAPRT